MNKSKIDWCDMTWNPVTGCLHGCQYCYARRIANRFGANLDRKGIKTVELHYKRDNPYPYNFYPTFHKYRLDEPKQRTKGRKIFVCSMADLFGDWVPDEWIAQVAETTHDCYQHKFLFLTKNPSRYKKISDCFMDNSWLGTTVTSNADIKRAWELLKLPRSTNTFLSIEPLSGEVDLDKYELLLKNWRNTLTIGKYLDWIIVGAQTGPGAVKPKTEWVQKIIDQARAAGIPVFLKDNLNWHEKIQEFPKEMEG